MIIIATGKYVGEGFDFARLDTLMLAMPISWKGTLQQYAGRLHRSYDGKEEVRIYDYIDINVSMLEKMYQKRLKGYSGIGYKIKCGNRLDKSVSSIFDNTNFLDVFAADISSVKHEALIVSPFVSKRTIVKILRLFEPIMDKLTIVTRPPEDYQNDIGKKRAFECIELLKSNNLQVLFKSKIHQKFAVLDQKLIWYGSINLLSFGSSEESIMRLENTDIAAELLGSVL